LTRLIAHVPGIGPVIMLRLRNMTAIDATGLRAIQDFADKLKETGRTLLLCGALPQPANLMAQAKFHRHLGARNILPNVQAALDRAHEIIGPPSSSSSRAAG
jgi:SulP family sulfate permease